MHRAVFIISAALAVFVAAVLPFAGRARACATCAVGDPTLNVMGVEQPFAGRTRIATEVRHFSETSGVQGETSVASSEQRLSLSLSHSPTPRLTLALRVPLVLRHLAFENLATETVVGPGDATVRARYVLYRDRTFAPSRLIWAHLGLEMPTAPIRQGPGGPLSLERQLGTGSWDTSMAIGGSYFANPYSVHGSALLFLPTRGTADSRVGTHLRTTLVGQLQPWSFLGFRLGLDARFEAATVENGAEDPSSGGIVGYITGGLIGSPATDIVTWLNFTMPVIQALNGEQSEGWQLVLGAALDV
ncbi:MAG: transporter [Deltaproteobacteria bacterium]|nr:MAG: transporter [Deltaproteobacteria bacterium]